MNTFCEHHNNSIKFGYRCFDRILLNGLIQPFQQPERVIGFFNTYREGKRVTRNCLGDIAEQFQNWVKNRCQKWGAPILDAPEGRRDDFVDPYLSTPRKISTTGWLTACAAKASILSNVPMPSSNAVVHRSFSNWRIP